MRRRLIPAVILLLLTVNSLKSQVNINFLSPDTVCTGAMINIINQTTGGTTYYWGFCSGNTINNPAGVNIGNPGSILDVPAYINLVEDNSGCYSFITNHGSIGQ